jgi:hypothetical protein
MTAMKRIDANLDAILKAGGSGLKYYTAPKVINAMRAEMDKLMRAEYVRGSHACAEALME